LGILGAWRARAPDVTIPPMMIHRKKWPVMMALAAAVLCVGGCVERKITIGSDPSGALLALNDQEVGRTPITVPFTWYGDYSVRLSYEKNVGTPQKPVMKRYFLQTHHRTKPPAFEWLGVDLFAELLPFRFKDEQVWAFAIPEVVDPTDPESMDRANKELIERADKLKARLNEPEKLQPPPKK
jgi:hypothetical protein